MKEEHRESTNLEGCTNLLNTIEKLAELKSQAEDLQQQIQNLQEQATSLQQATVAEITDRTNADASFAEVLAAEISERKSAIVDLQTTVNSFSDTYATSAELEAISTQVSDSSTEISNVRANIEDIVASMQSIDSSVGAVNTKLSNIFSAENFVEDFDTTIEPGIYCWTDSSKNRPANYGVLLVNRHKSTSDWINQIAYTTTNNRIYFRQRINDGEWRAWQTVAYTTDTEKTVTKKLVLSTVSVATTKYIKLGTFNWSESISFGCLLTGNNFRDKVHINILNGNSSVASVCGHYSTNARKTQAIVVKRGTSYDSNIEIYLKINQTTVTDISVTVDKTYQDRISLSESTTAPSGTLETITLDGYNGLFGQNFEGTITGNLTVKNDTTANLYAYGKEALTIGSDAAELNLGIDVNSIQVRKNNAADTLYLNYFGGMISVNHQNLGDSGLKVQGHLNIPTSAPSNPVKGDIWLVL